MENQDFDLREQGNKAIYFRGTRQQVPPLGGPHSYHSEAIHTTMHTHTIVICEMHQIVIGLSHNFRFLIFTVDYSKVLTVLMKVILVSVSISKIIRILFFKMGQNKIGFLTNFGFNKR